MSTYKEYTWEEYVLKQIETKIKDNKNEEITEEELKLLEEKHSFWNNQPVIKYSEEIKKNEEITEIEQKSESSKESISLKEINSNFSW
jgi:hypothetical protein